MQTTVRDHGNVQAPNPVNYPEGRYTLFMQLDELLAYFAGIESGAFLKPKTKKKKP